MKRQNIVLTLIIVMVLMAGLTVTASATSYSTYKTGKITADPCLNVRTAASSSSAVRGQLYENAAVTLKGYVYKGGYKWYKITYSGKTSYIRAKYVKTVSSYSYTIYTPKKYGYITADPFLYVRSSASYSAEPLGNLENGKKVVLKGYKGNWYRISYNGKAGYISKDYVKVITEAAYKGTASSKYTKYSTAKYGIVTADIPLNVRADAGTSYDSLGTLEPDTKLVLKGEKTNSIGGKWYCITYNGKAGYVYSQYVRVITREEYEKEIITGTDIAAFALKYKGAPYVSGGTDGAGFDSSGFVKFVYENFDVTLPHSVTNMRNYGKEVEYKDIAAGDIICYKGNVGIYTGSGKMIHSSKEAGCVVVDSAKYKDIITIRRIVE